MRTLEDVNLGANVSGNIIDNLKFVDDMSTCSVDCCGLLTRDLDGGERLDIQTPPSGRARSETLTRSHIGGDSG